MDRIWYHRLLYGAVKHGAFIEKRLARVLPEVALTERIGRESPLTIWRWTIHTRQKMDIFYLSIVVVLVLMIVVLSIGERQTAEPGGPSSRGGAHAAAQSLPLRAK
jgi:hypothetical protein